MKKLSLSVAFLFAMFGVAHAAPLKVASLHPLIGDLLRQVGGDQIEDWKATCRS
jgi:zinc/manganese transport system substrate-binding protein